MKYTSSPLKEGFPICARLISEIHASRIAFFLEGVAETGDGAFSPSRRPDTVDKSFFSNDLTDRRSNREIPR